MDWNEPATWKSAYAKVAPLEDSLFFADDVFGCQFGLRGEKVVFFDPETCLFEEVADSLEEWAQILLEDYSPRTGYPLAHAWQTQNHPLEAGSRLFPKIPFILGGQYEVNNLFAGDELERIRFLADLTAQLRDIPDGTTVTLKVVDPPKKQMGDA